MARFINLPGIDGSGPDHWQSRWEAHRSDVGRFQPPDWASPDLEDWIVALEEATKAGEPPVLVAHSLSCLLVAHWAARSETPVRGAFLVAVPDWAGPRFPKGATSFADPPLEMLRFPVFVVSSSSDPYSDTTHARRCANAWGGEVVILGDCGHINEDSGLGAWNSGEHMLAAFTSGLRR